MKNANRIDAGSLASLVLTLLAANDAQTARDLAGAIGCTAAALRPVLRAMVAAEVVVTSGLAGGTRYLLAADPVERPVQPVALEVSAAVQVQRADRASTAGLVLADESPAPAPRRHRAARPVIPATVDVLGALEQTAERLASGATLPELSARPAPARIVIAELAAEVDATKPVAAPVTHRDAKPANVLHRECTTPTEDAAARQLVLWESEQRAEAWDAATERQSRRQQLMLSLVSVVMVLAPVAWVLSHLAR